VIIRIADFQPPKTPQRVSVSHLFVNITTIILFVVLVVVHWNIAILLAF
jgi:hypothetical protein